MRCSHWTEAEVLAQVIAAKGLKGMDSNGLSDPYAWVKLGETKCRTKTISKSLEPFWNETFVFPAADVEATKGANLVFELWDSDFLAKDDFLGQVNFLCCCQCTHYEHCMTHIAADYIPHLHADRIGGSPTGSH